MAENNALWTWENQKYYHEQIMDEIEENTTGGSLTIDSELSDTSENAVQNKVIKNELDKKANTNIATTSTNGLMSSTDKTKLNITNIAYGTCTTAAATAAKIVTISGNTNWALSAGSVISIKFTYTNSAQNPTLNVNNTGAKSIIYNTSVITTDSLTYAGYAGRTSLFVYNGSQYVFAGWSIDNNTTYGNMTAATASAAGKSGLVPAPAAGKQTSFLRGDGKWVVPTNTTYSNFVKSGSGAKAGLVPAPSTTAGTTKYLREDGTWQVPPDEDTISKIYYAICTDTRDVIAKTITCDGFVLEAGSAIVICFTTTDSNTAPTSGNITLNVNGTGAKTIYNKSNTIYNYASYARFTKSFTWLFVYDGEKFICINQDDNTLYSPRALGFGYGTCSTEAATAAKVATLSGYVLTMHGIVAIKFTNAVPANATLNINSKGAKAIYYRGAAITAGIINAGDIATFIYDGTRYHLLTVDRSDYSIETYKVTIATTDWTTNVNGGYIATKTVTGVQTTDSIIADLVCSTDIDAAKLQIIAWSCICNGDIVISDADTITFYAYETKPTTAITVGLKVSK